jgi:L-fuculose-phosphate aldolase
MSEHDYRHEILRLGKLLHDKGFIASTDGNISVRLDDYTVLATPTCMSKGMMTTEDLVKVDMDGRKVSGFREVSSEIAMHLMIYRMRPEICGIVHAHPPTATGFAAAGLALEQALVSEIVLALGKVPLAPYGTPGTEELLTTLAPLVPEHNAILMANHGVVTYAEDLVTAYMNMETVEHFAKIALVTHQLGRQQVLSQENVDKLTALRGKFQTLMRNGFKKV